MDALFGLPRRKKAGYSYREPLRGKYFFANQDDVDEFVVKSTFKPPSNVEVHVYI